MTYTTTIKAVRALGLDKYIVDENVGTGDNSETSFDLDNGNVIAASYTLNYAASGSNDLTALTETTDYTLDKDSGRILLTVAGVAAVGTDILYATYTYTDLFPDSKLSQYVDEADDEVDALTGKKWDGPTDVTEYFDGLRTLDYPHTDQLYAQINRAWEGIDLRKKDVTQVKAVYFLHDAVVGQAWNYDANLATYTDVTDNTNDTTEDEFTIFAAVPAAGDLFYIGVGEKFLGIITSLTQVGTGTPAIVWEYYNGSTWAALTTTEVDENTATFEGTGRLTWEMPSSWEETTINSSDSLYFVRARLTTGYTIAPVCNSLAVKDVISSVIAPRSYKYDSWGRLVFTSDIVQDGIQNIRVDYSYGQETTPALISELTSVVVGIRAFVSITGGGYDDATSYSLGSKQVSIGEAYVNIREVLSQLTKRRNDLLNLFGSRGTVYA
jgi:hypothetical protein